MKPVSASPRRPAVGFRSGSIPPVSPSRVGGGDEAAPSVPDQVKADQVKADQVKADQVKADQVKADQVKADRMKADRMKADRMKTDQVKTDRMKADRMKTDQVKTDQVKTDRMKADRMKTDRVENEIVLSDDRAVGESPAPTMVGKGVGDITDSPFSKESAPAPAPAPEAPIKKKRSWMFWRRPSKRTLELAEVRKGCEKIEQVVGAIRDQLETAEKDRVVLNKALSPLPLAVDGLRRVGESQEQTNVVLQRVGDSLDRSQEKDKAFFKTMDRMGDTMSNMDMAVVGMGRTFSSIERTSKQSVDTMQRLSERLAESDRFLKETFQRLREAEREYGDYMRTNSRRSAMVTITLCALMTLGIAVLAHTLGGASHNVTVLRPHVPAPLNPETPVVPMLDTEPVPVDWHSEPADQWMGVAGDVPTADLPMDDLSAIPAPVELPERFEDLISTTAPTGE